MRKFAWLIRDSIIGLTLAINPLFLAIKRTPRTPVIDSPKRTASHRPRRSSINNSSAFHSQARAIASASPRSKLYSFLKQATSSKLVAC